MIKNQIKETISSQPGTYILLLKATKEEKVQVGSFGPLDMKKGYYVYVGSALGPGGVQSRVNRHAKKDKKLHWHIDYLRATTDLLEVWYTYSQNRYEHKWAKVLQSLPKVSIPLPGFGASDCNCRAHLFFFRGKPSLDDFYNQLDQIEEVKKLEF
ncbi:GIY-YIG nuclease family protein [Halanaerocella petrolearia]